MNTHLSSVALTPHFGSVMSVSYGPDNAFAWKMVSAECNTGPWPQTSIFHTSLKEMYEKFPFSPVTLVEMILAGYR